VKICFFCGYLCAFMVRIFSCQKNIDKSWKLGIIILFLVKEEDEKCR